MTNIREIYESPEMELVLFDADDIITTSIIDVTPDEDETPINPWG